MENLQGKEMPVILAIDDAPDILRMIQLVLQGSYKVHTLSKPEKMDELLEKIKPDLFLLDYSMPEMTGFEVLLQIRSNPYTKDVPIVFLTGITNERMRQEMMGRGATDFLCKPIEPEELKRCVRKHLS